MYTRLACIYLPDTHNPPETHIIPPPPPPQAIPPLRPLVLVLKAFLKEACLNEVFTGGLSSYALVLLVLAHLQAEVCFCGVCMWCVYVVCVCVMVEMHGVLVATPTHPRAHHSFLQPLSIQPIHNNNNPFLYTPSSPSPRVSQWTLQIRQLPWVPKTLTFC